MTFLNPAFLITFPVSAFLTWYLHLSLPLASDCLSSLFINIVNIEEVIRYFVVHNFSVNFDSYTGSMIHNYYLYEEDGKMEMIPWDYNLAFGGFMSQSDATALVNYPVDSPVSGGTIDSRPMLAWIFSNEEYTALYHEYFAEFLTMFFADGAFEEMIDSVSEMIAPYIEKQPTEFCTYEEFLTGVEALKAFCLLRAESIDGQLNGTIPSTSEGQAQDSSSLIKADDLNISDMGSMGNRGGFGDGGDREQIKQPQPQDDTGISAEASGTPEQNRPFPGGDNANTPNTQNSNLLSLGISVLILGAGLTFAILYGKKRH